MFVRSRRYQKRLKLALSLVSPMFSKVIEYECDIVDSEGSRDPDLPVSTLMPRNQSTPMSYFLTIFFVI